MEKEKWLSLVLGLGEGQTPFPWQSRLLNLFLEGQIPRVLDLPTGLGKTSVMAIWLLARAWGAKIPRRLFYIVDRRTVVDQATEDAERLRALVDRHLELKEGLGLPEGTSLPVSTLRGQYVDNKQWLSDPSLPSIVVGTVDMIGSRLLFQGYAVSSIMRPYHAGLMGVDSLMVLDESHLVPPFRSLLEKISDDIEQFGASPSHREIVSHIKLMFLSATETKKGSVFSLVPEEDLQHPEAKRRVTASKRAVVVKTKKKTPEALLDLTWQLYSAGTLQGRVVIYSNERKVALSVAEGLRRKLRKLHKKSYSEDMVLLLVGATRAYERQQISSHLKEQGFTGHGPLPLGTSFLVATSAGEVGIDLDADYMVMDLVTWERMVQRFGRLNRFGRGKALAFIINNGTSVEGKDEGMLSAPLFLLPQCNETPLVELPAGFEHVGCFNINIEALLSLSQRAGQDKDVAAKIESATSVPPLHPPLSRALVDSWALTSLDDHPGRPHIEPWLRGWEEHEPQVRLLWRAHIPATSSLASTKDIREFFRATGLHPLEILEIEVSGLTGWLKKHISILLKNGNTFPSNRPIAIVLEPDFSVKAILTWGELHRLNDTNSKTRSSMERRLKELLSYRYVVFDATLGGLDESGHLAPGHEAPVLCGDEPPHLSANDTIASLVPFMVLKVDEGPVPEIKGWRIRYEHVLETDEEGEPLSLLVVYHQKEEPEEEGRSNRLQLLSEHTEEVVRALKSMTTRLALPAELVQVLVLAAKYHDIGKAESRWQLAADVPPDNIYAKSPKRMKWRLLEGYRHEFGSLLRLLQAPPEEWMRLRPELRELVLHLVAAHHGRARPTMPISGVDSAPPSKLESIQEDIMLRFASLQEEWGPWGLAWLETLLRAADHMASRR